MNKNNRRYLWTTMTSFEVTCNLPSAHRTLISKIYVKKNTSYAEFRAAIVAAFAPELTTVDAEKRHVVVYNGTGTCAVVVCVCVD